MFNKSILAGVTHKVPEDLKVKLMTNEIAFQIWQGLTPLARNEWICWTMSVKLPETRTKHVERVIKHLIEGKRRPCCWIGCTHREKSKKIS